MKKVSGSVLGLLFAASISAAANASLSGYVRPEEDGTCGNHPHSRLPAGLNPSEVLAYLKKVIHRGSASHAVGAALNLGRTYGLSELAPKFRELHSESTPNASTIAVELSALQGMSDLGGATDSAKARDSWQRMIAGNPEAFRFFATALETAIALSSPPGGALAAPTPFEQLEARVQRELAELKDSTGTESDRSREYHRRTDWKNNELPVARWAIQVRQRAFAAKGTERARAWVALYLFVNRAAGTTGHIPLLAAGILRQEAKRGGTALREILAAFSSGIKDPKSLTSDPLLLSHSSIDEVVIRAGQAIPALGGKLSSDEERRVQEARKRVTYEIASLLGD